MHFDALLLLIAYKNSAQKSTEKWSLITLKKDPDLTKKIDFFLKNNMRNFVNFNLSNGKFGLWWATFAESMYYWAKKL